MAKICNKYSQRILCHILVSSTLYYYVELDEIAIINHFSKMAISMVEPYIYSHPFFQKR